MIFYLIMLFKNQKIDIFFEVFIWHGMWNIIFWKKYFPFSKEMFNYIYIYICHRDVFVK
jgi:hypothetical protein